MHHQHGAGNGVIHYFQEGGVINETVISDFSDIDEKVETLPTIFFVEIDEDKREIRKILSKVEGSISTEIAEKEYQRLIDATEWDWEKYVPPFSGIGVQIKLWQWLRDFFTNSEGRFSLEKLTPWNDKALDNTLKWVLPAIVIIGIAIIFFYASKFFKR